MARIASALLVAPLLLCAGHRAMAASHDPEVFLRDQTILIKDFRNVQKGADTDPPDNLSGNLKNLSLFLEDGTVKFSCNQEDQNYDSSCALTLYCRDGSNCLTLERGSMVFHESNEYVVFHDQSSMKQFIAKFFGQSGDIQEEGDLTLYESGFAVGRNSVELRVKNTAQETTYKLLSYSIYNCSGTGAGQCGTTTNGPNASLMTLAPGQDRSLKVVVSGNTDANGRQPSVSFTYSWIYVSTNKGAKQRKGSGQASAAGIVAPYTGPSQQTNAPGTDDASGQETINIGGLNFIKGREPKSLGTITVPNDSDDSGN